MHREISWKDRSDQAEGEVKAMGGAKGKERDQCGQAKDAQSNA